MFFTYLKTIISPVSEMERKVLEMNKLIHKFEIPASAGVLTDRNHGDNYI